MSKRITRRTFVQSIGYAGLSLPLISPKLVRGASPNDKITIAFVATSGKGGVHVEAFKTLACTCYADVDTENWKSAAKNWPDAKPYQNYRQMYEKHHREFDAVAIATPDHNHFHAALYAMQLGKHVYCEKPLTHDVWEARMLTEAAKKYKVQTQMCNQGHSKEGWRLFIEWVKAGSIGEVKEVHSWTNRPIWPQGLPRPTGSTPVPANLDWETWIGPAPFRPYFNEEVVGKNGKKKSGHGTYHQFSWRGRVDFGAGALGDMACHTMDGIQWLMEPGHPSAVEVLKTEGDAPDGDSYPQKAVIRWEFPATTAHGPWTHTWYDGGFMPERPSELPADRKMPISGNLVVGSKGKIFITGDYGDSPRIIPQEEMDRFLGQFPDHKVPQLIPRVQEIPGIGVDLHHSDFINAIRTGKPAGSNFAYAGPFTEVVQLGNVALRAGKRIEWDGVNMKAKNVTGIDHLIRREYRKGWEVTSI